MARVSIATARPSVRALTPGRLATLALAVGLVLLIAHGISWSTRDGRGLLDWGSFWASGDAANHGKDPYGVYPDTFRVGPGAMPAPNLNPPISVYPLQLAAKFDVHHGETAWIAASLAGALVAIVLLYRAYPRSGVVGILWALAFAGLWHTVELGQIYVPLLLAATGAWLLLRDRDDWRAGLLIGFVVAIKPQFVAWPILLLLARHPRSASASFATAAVLSAVPFVLEGPEIYRQWLDATPPILPANLFPGNSSILSVAGRLHAGRAGLVLSALVFAAVAGVVFRRRPDRMAVSAAGLILAFLLGPISWPGYSLLLLPVFFTAGWQATFPAALLMVFPYSEVLKLQDAGQPAAFLAASIYFFAAVLLAATLLREPRLLGSAARRPEPEPEAGPVRTPAAALE
ncbi:MAG: glycosyltransferase family 87 protein [Hyphomicrobiales bacterium]